MGKNPTLQSVKVETFTRKENVRSRSQKIPSARLRQSLPGFWGSEASGPSRPTTMVDVDVLDMFD